MKITVKHLLEYDGKQFWIIGSGVPKVDSRWPKHVRFLVIPKQTYTSDKHSYSRVVLVPADGYMISFHSDTIIEVQDTESVPEPEWPQGVVEPQTGRFIPDEELMVNK